LDERGQRKNAGAAFGMSCWVAFGKFLRAWGIGYVLIGSLLDKERLLSGGIKHNEKLFGLVWLSLVLEMMFLFCRVGFVGNGVLMF